MTILNRGNFINLGIDIDDTLATTAVVFASKMQQLFGNPEGVTPQQLIAKYTFVEKVPYWQTDEIKEWISTFVIHPDCCRDLEPIPGSVEALRRLAKNVNVAAYITARFFEIKEETRSWLQRHGFPDAPIICRSGETSLERGVVWKASIIENMFPKINVMIDDHPELNLHLSENYQGVLIHYGACPIVEPRKPFCISCRTWQEVERFFEQQILQETEINNRVITN